jgi:hypothetical protein
MATTNNEIKMAGFLHPGFAVTIDEVESTVDIAQPFVGTITNLETGEIIHTAYGEYLMRVVGLLRIWLWGYLNSGRNTAETNRRFRYGN